MQMKIRQEPGTVLSPAPGNVLGGHASHRLITEGDLYDLHQWYGRWRRHP